MMGKTNYSIYLGHFGHAVSHLGQAVLHRVLQPCGGDNGHDGPHQQRSQLHPLLPHVFAVQSNREKDPRYPQQAGNHNYEENVSEG